MPNSFKRNLCLNITYGKPIPLSKFENPISELGVSGIYFLREGRCRPENFDPLGDEVVYIGKAKRETIFTRCRKHLRSIKYNPNAPGKRRTNPGKRFQEYRKSRNFNPDGLFVIPGFMNEEELYLISCAEELMLFEFHKKHGEVPKANTAR